MSLPVWFPWGRSQRDATDRCVKWQHRKDTQAGSNRLQQRGPSNALLHSFHHIKFSQFAVIIIRIEFAVCGQHGLNPNDSRRVRRDERSPQPAFASSQIHNIHISRSMFELENKQGAAVRTPSNRPVTAPEAGDRVRCSPVNWIGNETVFISRRENDKLSVRGDR